MIQEIEQLESKFKDFERSLANLEGQYESVSKNYESKVTKQDQLDHDLETHTKAVEVLTLVQQASRDKVKNGFEDIVSWALTYIFQKEYKFCLEFGKRGNLGELNFAVQSPDFDEPADPMDSRGGGIMNVISLILRLVLMEISTPKIPGFIIFDESFKNVNGAENIEQLNYFVQEMNQKFKRQIISITDMESFKNFPEAKIIEIK